LITNYTLQEFKCEICGIKYKTKRGLNHHQSIVRKYNVRREGLYVLPLEAVNQFKKDLIYIIGSKLKAHFTQSGRQTLSFSYAYMQLASIFDNQNWGRKFFDNDQQTFILLFDAQAKKRSNHMKKSRFPELMIE
ncbi:1365_t:CDS:2, partial [Cetraspora pellucida]